MDLRADKERHVIRRDGDGMGAAKDDSAVSEASVRAALTRILGDAQFHASARNRRFLEFVVEESLAGRRNRVKAYTIAVDVFGRAAGFDSALDPIVRIEAMRLRAALSAYYAGPGRDQDIRIHLPKGAYVPVFENARSTHSPLETQLETGEAPPDAQATPPQQVVGDFTRQPFIRRNRPALLALLVLAAAGAVLLRNYATAPSQQSAIIIGNGQSESSDAESDQIAIGLAQSVAWALSRFDGPRVFSAPPGLSFSAAIGKLDAAKDQPGTIYALETGARRQDQLIRFTWSLKDAKTGETVWADVADRPFSKGMTTAVEDEIAGKIATVIGQPQGLVASRELGIAHIYPTTGYGCLLRSRAYYLSISESLHREVRDCLERTVAAAPDYAEAWAMLAFVYLDEDRNNFNRRSTAEDALSRAIDSAQRAAELKPASETAQEALMAVFYRKGDFDIAFAAGERALEINPRNPELLAELGNRLFARGHWDEGVKLVREAIDRMLIIPPLDRVTLVLDSYRRGDYRGAAEQAELIDLPDYYGAFLVRAATYGELGNTEEAQKNIRALLVLRPNYATEMRAELRNRHYTEPLIDMLAEGLNKAGLNVH